MARRHPSGRRVIERAAILAEGADCTAVVAWIIANRGEPVPPLPAMQHSYTVHGSTVRSQRDPRAPVRYVLPADAFT
jgi:hypothetical protein